MTEATPNATAGGAAATKSIVVEREMPHAPEKIWRALTTSALIADWLMENDFEPEVGRKFQFRAKSDAGLEGHHQLRSAGSRPAEPPRLYAGATAARARAASGRSSPGR